MISKIENKRREDFKTIFMTDTGKLITLSWLMALVNDVFS